MYTPPRTTLDIPVNLNTSRNLGRRRLCCIVELTPGYPGIENLHTISQVIGKTVEIFRMNVSRFPGMVPNQRYGSRSLMGKSAESRFNFIQDNAEFVEDLDI